MVTNQCPIYCRFCTRKRLVGKPGFLKKGELDRAIAYLREHSEVRDVILSGGDPLLLPDHLLERILKALRTIPHLELIRLGSRVPGTLPERITPKLCAIVKKYHPIYMNLHFNHPDELTPEVKAACGMLADAGIPLGRTNGASQRRQRRSRHHETARPSTPAGPRETVLSVSSGPDQGHKPLSHEHRDGTEHHQSAAGSHERDGRAAFCHRAPGGGGKIPLLPGDYVVHMDEDGAVLRNYENKTFHYPQPKAGNGSFETGRDRRELPMVGARTYADDASCADSYPDRDSYASWGNSCGGDADDL